METHRPAEGKQTGSSSPESAPSMAHGDASGGRDTCLRVDGEPWRQDVPDTADGEPLKVHIKLASVPGRVLVNKDNLPLKVILRFAVYNISQQHALRAQFQSQTRAPHTHKHISRQELMPCSMRSECAEDQCTSASKCCSTGQHSLC